MIGLFDSGIGGLSILRSIRRQMPKLDIVYLADTANFPFGTKPDEAVCELSLTAKQRLVKAGAKLIVVACNTATTVSLARLREGNDAVPIIGTVPVVKTLATSSRNKKVAVLATDTTIKSEYYQHLRDEYLTGFDVLELALPEWVEIVESGDVHGSRAQAAVQAVAEKIQERQVDAVALGCTHFPFLKRILGSMLPGVIILDSGAAVGRQVARVLQASGQPTVEHGQVTYLTTAQPEQFSRVASDLMDQRIQATLVQV